MSLIRLYGLATFSAQRRTREIGIRKVLGATVSSLTLTVSKDFLKLVLVAIAIGIPISIWLVSAWLQQFASRIDLAPPLFLWAGLIAVGIAVFTVSGQAIRAALINPVESLRSE